VGGAVNGGRAVVAPAIGRSQLPPASPSSKASSLATNGRREDRVIADFGMIVR
jgi:hypothetical protein